MSFDFNLKDSLWQFLMTSVKGMKNLSLCLSWKILIFSSVLKNCFAEPSVVISQGFFFLCPLNISFQSLLYCKFSAGKYGYSLMETSFCTVSSFSPATYKILSLSVIFDYLIIICLGMSLLGFILVGVLFFSFSHFYVTFLKIEKFLAFFLQIIPLPFHSFMGASYAYICPVDGVTWVS